MSTEVSVSADLPGSGELTWSDLDRRVTDTVRVLAMDAVEKSGTQRRHRNQWSSGENRRSEPHSPPLP